MMRRILSVSWYVIWPAATVLIGRTIYERGCLGLAEPWPWLYGRALLSLLVGATYVCAHWWSLVWLLTTWSSGRWDFGSRVDVGQAAAMFIVLAVDYSPLTPWRWILHALGC